MERAPGFYLYLYTICILLCRVQIKGRACLPTYSPTISMCQSGQITGKQIYLDTSDFAGPSVYCTCRLEPRDAGGSVTFDPVVVDQTNCNTSILMHDFRFVHDCTSNGDRVGYLSSGASIDLTVLGQGRMESCVRLYTEVPEMTLNVTCHQPMRVTSSTPAATTTATTPILTTSSPVTRETTPVQARVCRSSTIPVVSMCESQAEESWRISIDSSVFSDQYSSCTCTVRMVSMSGASVSIYPDVIDHNNCNTGIYLDQLSYYIGCSTSTHASVYLNQFNSFDLVIRGQGSLENCVLIQASSRDTTLRVECSHGILRNATSITTSPSTTATTRTTAAATTTTVSPSPSPSQTTTTVSPSTSTTSRTTTTVSSSTSTTSQTTTTISPSTSTTSPTTVTVSPSTSTTSQTTTTLPTSASTTVQSTTDDIVTDTDKTSTTVITTSTLSTTAEMTSPTSLQTTVTPTVSTETSSSTPQRTTDTTSVTSTFTSQSTSETPETTPSLSTLTTTPGNETTTDKKKDDDTFPATELIVGLTAGVVVVLILIAVFLCYRERQRKGNGEKQHILPVSPVTSGEMREIETVTVENPMYFSGDNVSTFPRSTKPDMQTNGVTAPDDISAMYATVNKQKPNTDDILY